jgi:ubiquinone/menaquinone biosynthesis C-methylase UbiE
MESKINYEKFYDQVGERIGWDFSKIKITTEGEKWDFYQEVLKRCKNSDLLLDIGTGGGEKVLKIASSLLLLIGIDKSREMIKTANRNLEKSQLSNVRFFQMDAKEIMFPDGFFDVVSCRHANFFPKEVARVLIDRGIFLTQQVSEADKMNIMQAFGRGQSFGIKDGTAKRQYIESLKKVGFSDVESFDYDAYEFYHTAEDLIFLLRNTPIIPDFGKQPEDFRILSRFIEENRTDRGIKTNSKRYMIIAKK